MNRDSLQRALIDLGWLALIQRALGSKPSASYALYQLMRAAGRPLTVRALADEYALASHGIGRGHVGTNWSRNAVVQRVSRARAALADMGVEDVIQACVGEQAYLIEKRDLPRIEAALLFACGIELTEAAA